MPSSLPYGNANKLVLVDVIWSPVSVAANTTAAQNVTVPGVIPGQDFCFDITKPTEQAGLAIGSTRVSAANVVTVVFVNDTAAPIVPTAAERYTFGIMRRDGPATGVMS
jgi:hypothetical protein